MSEPTAPQIAEPGLAVDPDSTIDRTTSRSNTPGGPLTTGAVSISIPGYEILGELGRGGMGVVYKARQIKLNRDVALKTIRAADGADRVAVARFWAEAEVMAAVKHPHVVQVHELGEGDGVPFLAMELLPGGTLAARLKATGPLAAVAAAELVGKIARGVAAAHELGIVHRDLKPGNVLLDEFGEPKVTDFGLAKRGTSDLTQTNALMGTPAYVSPEQAGGKAKFVGPPADVWALGVILYQCLTGNRPFVGDSTAEVLSRVLNAEPPPLRSQPRDLRVICKKCLEKDPTDRYPSAKELADDLQRFVRGEPIAVRPTGWFERGYKWARRKPTVAAMYAALIVAAISLVVGGVLANAWSVASTQKQKAEQAEVDALGAKAEALVARDLAQSATTEAVLERGKAERAEAEAKQARNALARLNYAHTVDLAHREYQAGNLSRARTLLENDNCPERLRGWEWHYLHRLCHAELLTLRHWTGVDPRFPQLSESKGVRVVRFSPDGTRIMTVGMDGNARIWDVKTGKVLSVFKEHAVRPLYTGEFSPDGTRAGPGVRRPGETSGERSSSASGFGRVGGGVAADFNGAGGVRADSGRAIPRGKDHGDRMDRAETATGDARIPAYASGEEVRAAFRVEELAIAILDARSLKELGLTDV